MNFDSAIFLFLAFPILMIIYILLGKKARNVFRFITNILLYAFGEPIYIFLLLLIFYSIVSYIIRLKR